MKSIKYRRRTFLIVIIWMAVIFLMSAQSGDESGEVSGSVSYKIVTAADVVLHWNLSEGERLKRAQAIQHPVRKCAHMTEYAILAILLVLHLNSYPLLWNTRRRWAFAWMLAVLYASTDEYHQTFIEGRSGNPIDVCIDGTGALIGLLILGLICLGSFKQKGGRDE